MPACLLFESFQRSSEEAGSGSKSTSFLFLFIAASHVTGCTIVVPANLLDIFLGNLVDIHDALIAWGVGQQVARVKAVDVLTFPPLFGPFAMWGFPLD